METEKRKKTYPNACDGSKRTGEKGGEIKNKKPSHILWITRDGQSQNLISDL